MNLALPIRTRAVIGVRQRDIAPSVQVAERYAMVKVATELALMDWWEEEMKRKRARIRFDRRARTPDALFPLYFLSV
jgi:hypothetical protein